MKLEQQVTSLELSKRLKELGVKQESLFYWGQNSNDWELRLNEIKSILGSLTHYSAFTASELGEMLPDITKPCYYLTIQIGTTMMTPRWGWKVFYMDDDDVPLQHADTEANARAKMLIYLLENKLITL